MLINAYRETVGLWKLITFKYQLRLTITCRDDRHDSTMDTLLLYLSVGCVVGFGLRRGGGCGWRAIGDTCWCLVFDGQYGGQEMFIGLYDRIITVLSLL